MCRCVSHLPWFSRRARLNQTPQTHLPPPPLHTVVKRDSTGHRGKRKEKQNNSFSQHHSVKAHACRTRRDCHGSTTTDLFKTTEKRDTTESTCFETSSCCALSKKTTTTTLAPTLHRQQVPAHHQRPRQRRGGMSRSPFHFDSSIVLASFNTGTFQRPRPRERLIL